MANIPQKVADRITASIKKFQPIFTAAKDHDANELAAFAVARRPLSQSSQLIEPSNGMQGTFDFAFIRVSSVAR
jgi:hypothetical protein